MGREAKASLFFCPRRGAAHGAGDAAMMMAWQMHPLGQGVGATCGRPGECGDRRGIPPPIFFSVLPKRKRAVDGPKEKNASRRTCTFVQVCLHTEVFRIGADKDREVFCRLAPDRSLARVLRRDCGSGGNFGVVVERSVLLKPLALCLVVDGGGWFWAVGQTGVHPVESFAEEHGS